MMRHSEKRLIDANAFKIYLEEIRQEMLEENTMSSDFAAEVIETVQDEYLQNAPTVDAVEVVHGEWEITEDDYFDLVELKCAVCGESYGFEDYEDCIPQNYHYCPNCGAKMDGDRNGM